jgi:hypothetical protein
LETSRSGASGDMRGPAIAGLVLGVVGALLDFYAAYSIISQSAATGEAMGVMVTQYSPYGLAWGAAVLVLGALVAASAVLGVTSLGMRRMGMMGTLMAAYGVAMLLVGAAMSSGAVQMMGGALASGIGMLVVGALMVANGAWMRRGGRRM